MTRISMNRSALAQILGRQLLERRLAGAGGYSFGVRLTQQLQAGQVHYARLRDRTEDDAVMLRFHQSMQRCYQLAIEVMQQTYPGLKQTGHAAAPALPLPAGSMTCPDELIELAHLARVRNLLQQSEQMFEALISMFPESLRAHMGLGMLRLDQGVYAAAQLSFETACWLAPGDGTAHIWLGLVLLMQERHQQAAEVIGLALQDGHVTPVVLVARSLLSLPVLAPFAGCTGHGEFHECAAIGMNRIVAAEWGYRGSGVGVGRCRQY